MSRNDIKSDVEESESTFEQTRRDNLKGILGGSAAVFGLGGSMASSAAADSGKEHDKICFMPVPVLAKCIREGELSPVEVVDAFLDRIEDREDDINAFVELIPDQAREAAKEAERAVECGEELGPLHGIPFGVKDLDPLEEVRYTNGSLVYKDRIAEETDSNVQTFLDAGAIPIGKTNTPEGGFMGKTDNLVVGPTSTPFEIGRNSGGSSGGSAAAVAGGLLPFGTGSDGAGSIRIPASFTGTYGLFPRIEDPGNFGESFTYVHTGVQTRSVAGTACTLDVMFDESDDEMSYQEALDRDVADLKIGYTPDLGTWPVDKRVRNIVGEGVQTITEKGATVEDVDLDLLQSYDDLIKGLEIVWSTTYANTARTYLEEEGIDMLGDDSDMFLDALVDMVETGEEYLDEEGNIIDEALNTVVEARARAYSGINPYFEEYDLIATSTLSVPPFTNDVTGPTEVEGIETHPVYGWLITATCNMAGLPAASVPAGLTNDGLPVGMMLIGPSHDDKTIVSASAAYEEVNPWHNDYPAA